MYNSVIVEICVLEVVECGFCSFVGRSVTWFSIMPLHVSSVTPDPEGKNERVFQLVCFVLHFISSLLTVINFRYNVFQLVV